MPVRLALLVLCLAAAPATAQDHSGHDMIAMPGMSADPASPAEAYARINAEMHAAMAIAFTGDADIDFIRGMIPHHRAAVDMARVVLDHGSDPEVRALARTVVDTQQAEIDWMEDWLAAHDK